MNDQSTNPDGNVPEQAVTPASVDATSRAESAGDVTPNRSGARPRGVGAMGPRMREPDDLAPPREAVDHAKHTARETGHRFDLMRYLRLRRKS
jgi:hypothetical protein